MEKATAELDGTLVFNYIVEIDDDDDDDEVQIHETLAAEEEPKLDTSFDENQNPKLQSKTTAQDTPKKDKDPTLQPKAAYANTAEETPKKDKDLVVLLESRVLTPRKLLSAVDQGKTNDSTAAKLDAASRESSNLQPLNSTEVESGSLRIKRARSPEIIKGSPKIKKVKTKDTVKNLNGKKLTDPVGLNELESLKPKRGRPKSIRTNKLVNSASELHSTPKKTEESILKGKQDAVEEIKNLEILKPIRGRPKSIGTNGVASSSSESHAAPKETEESLSKGKQNAVKEIKNLEILKPVRGRPKSVGTNKVVSSANESHSTAKETAESLLKGKQDAVEEIKNVVIIKPMRGRPKIIGTNKVVSSASESHSTAKETEESLLTGKQDAVEEIQNVEIVKPMRGRPKSIGTNKAVSSASESHSTAKETVESLLTGKQDAVEEIKNVEIVKPMRGRPKSKGTNKAVSSASESHSTAKETAESLLKGKQDAVEEIKNLEILKPVRGRPKSVGTNKVVSSASESHSTAKETAESLLKGKQDAVEEIKNVVIVKPMRGRPKSIGTNKVVSSASESHSTPKETQENLLKGKLDAVQEIKNVEILKPMRGRPKVQKKLNSSVRTIIALESSIPKKTKEIEDKLSNTVSSKVLPLVKPKRGRPKSSGTKKVDISTATSLKLFRAEKLTKKCVESKQLNALVDMTQSQPCDIMETNLEPEQQEAIVESTGLDPSKPKRGRPKGFKLKKNNVSIGITNLKLSDSQKIEDLVAKERSFLVSSDPGNNLDSSKTTTLKALGLKAKQAVTQESAVGDLGGKSLNSARTKYLVPSKIRRGRSKGLKTKKVTFSISNKIFAANPTQGNLSTVTDSSKSLVIEAADLIVKQADASVKADDTENNLEALKSEKPEYKDLVATKLDVTDKIDKVEPPKAKRGKPKGSVTKKRKQMAPVIDLGCPKASEISITNINPEQLDSSMNPKVPESLQSNIIEAKKVEVKKVTDSVVRTKPFSSKSIGTEKSGLDDKQQNTAMEIIDLDAPKAPKVLGPRKDHVSVVAKCLKLKAKGTKKISSEEKNDDVIETIDLEAPKVKIAKVKGIETKKTKDDSTARGLNISKGSGTRPRGARANQFFGTKKIAFSHLNKPAGYVEGEKPGDIVEIIDLQPPKHKTGRSKKNTLGPKRVKTFVAMTESQPSTSKESIETINLELPKPKNIETIDLELPTPNRGRMQGLEIKKINLFEKSKDHQPPKVAEVNIGTVNEKIKSSEHKEPDWKGKRKADTSKGNKDFKFPKPKRAKTLLVKSRSVAAFVMTKDLEQTKFGEGETENAQPKQDASVGTKDLAPPKSKESDVQILPRKPVFCTVGTQTIEEDEEDILKALEVKTAERKMSVSSVGTQVIEPLKPNQIEVKELGRKISVSSIEVINLNVPTAKSTAGRPVVEKGASVGKKPFEPALPKGAKASESGDKSEHTDEETFKIEEDNLIGDVIQPILAADTLEENTELGVKYETVEQIHTEFKYESQSETEVMMKRRRGKLGGPMRGKRRGFNKLEGQTTIDSFFRIVDLNGKLQMKNRNLIYKCDHCLYVGNSKANLERHSLIHRNADEIMWFHCTECPYKSKYEHQLKSHFLIHLKPDQIHFFHCPHCDIKCSRKHNLTNHIKSIHADRENSFKCAECPYTTFSKDRLVAHLRKHSKEVHACTMCKFVTKRQEYLESHVKMKHTAVVPRPYPCDTCSYKGKTKRELDKHYDRMHNKEQLHVYQCNHCTFNSIYKKNLEFHLLHMHNNSEGFQKFICGHCQKSFSYKNGLKVHIIRCHIKLPDDDWHKCMECKYKSKDVSTLKRHIKRNHGAPRLHCKQCSFATNRQTSMDAHLKTHEYDNEDILKCPECPYRIIQMSSFQYHMKVIHGKPITYKDALQYYMQDE